MEAILVDVLAAYGDLGAPSYSFAPSRLEAGMHADTLRRLSSQFAVDDQTSLGSDDVCLSLFVHWPTRTSSPPWFVRLSLVGRYALVSRLDQSDARHPAAHARRDAETALLRLLREDGFALLPLAVLQEPTALRPPNAEAGEVYTLYNALFTDAIPGGSVASMIDDLPSETA